MDRNELKKRRWRLLPWRIKLVFWVGALPLFLFSCVAWFAFEEPAPWATVAWVAAAVTYGYFECLCYNWYSKEGLL